MMIKIGKKITSAVLASCVLCSIFSVSAFAVSDNEVGSDNYNTEAVKLSFGYAHSAYITENGDLYTWGVNDVGRLGDGTTIDKYTPTEIMGNVKTVSPVSYQHLTLPTTPNV